MMAYMAEKRWRMKGEEREGKASKEAGSGGDNQRGRRDGGDRIHCSLDVTNIIESRGSHVNDELLDG